MKFTWKKTCARCRERVTKKTSLMWGTRTLCVSCCRIEFREWAWKTRPPERARVPETIELTDEDMEGK
jgi:hypothetical protein